MKEAYKEKLRELKNSFRHMDKQAKEALGVCLLKVNLGVASSSDKQIVKKFVGDFPIRLGIGTLDTFIDYLHRKGSRTESVHISSKDASLSSSKNLPPYLEDQVDTLRESTRIRKLNLRQEK